MKALAGIVAAIVALGALGIVASGPTSVYSLMFYGGIVGALAYLGIQTLENSQISRHGIAASTFVGCLLLALPTVFSSGLAYALGLGLGAGAVFGLGAYSAAFATGR